MVKINTFGESNSDYPEVFRNSGAGTPAAIQYISVKHTHRPLYRPF